jgi:hypothetical protein
MKISVLIVVNLALWGLFVFLLRRPGLLTTCAGGRFWLTWLGVGVITLMDELTSVFYAPAEAYRLLGPGAIFFIALTAVLIWWLTTRLVEIAEILEHHKLFRGGVYSFSYSVLVPVVSCVAVSSIMVDYILTACISAISAIENATSFYAISHVWKRVTAMVMAWCIPGLYILGIRENVRFVFGVFVLAGSPGDRGDGFQCHPPAQEVSSVRFSHRLFGARRIASEVWSMPCNRHPSVCTTTSPTFREFSSDSATTQRP